MSLQAATGDIELTHGAFHALEPWRAAAHRRELLMSCGVLPAVDKQICSFELWLIGHLDTIADPDHGQVIRRFATWEVLPRLRTSSQKKPITPAARRHAADQVKQATAFRTWLAARDHTLGICGRPASTPGASSRTSTPATPCRPSCSGARQASSPGPSGFLQSTSSGPLRCRSPADPGPRQILHAVHTEALGLRGNVLRGRVLLL
ncbi:hypothetical protein ACFWPV_39380, partial [Streptomyces uncialis]